MQILRFAQDDNPGGSFRSLPGEVCRLNGQNGGGRLQHFFLAMPCLICEI